MDITIILNYLIRGLSLGSVYAIIALGYTMVYGIAKMLNFAHGDVIMVGGYVCFFAMSGLSGNFAEGSVAATVVAPGGCDFGHAGLHGAGHRRGAAGI